MQSQSKSNPTWLAGPVWHKEKGDSGGPKCPYGFKSTRCFGNKSGWLAPLNWTYRMHNQSYLSVQGPYQEARANVSCLMQQRHSPFLYGTFQKRHLPLTEKKAKAILFLKENYTTIRFLW